MFFLHSILIPVFGFDFKERKKSDREKIIRRAVDKVDCVLILVRSR